MKSDPYPYSSSFNSDYPSHDETLRSWQEPITKDKDMQKCSIVLRKAFQVCDDAMFPELACVISCVLSSGQNLSMAALRDALAIFVDGTSPEISKRSVSDFSEWLGKFRYLFVVKGSDRVAFKLPSMTQFLLSFTIRGIDASHRTIAIVCLAQVMSDIENQRRCKHNTRSDLAMYAERNATRHKLIAERSNICLRWRSRTGTRNFSSMNLPNLKEGSKTRDAGHITCFDQTLSCGRCEENEDDWILCDFDKWISELGNVNPYLLYSPWKQQKHLRLIQMFWSYRYKFRECLTRILLS